LSEFSELYQEVILDHNRRPRNFRVIEHPDGSAVGHNPLCGDEITVYVDMDGDAVRDVTFQGAGCAISKASASMMTEAIRGKSRDEVIRLFDEFHRMVTDDPSALPDVERMGKLAAFSGVCEFPARVKCASLAWHTLLAALKDGKGNVTTE